MSLHMENKLPEMDCQSLSEFSSDIPGTDTKLNCKHVSRTSWLSRQDSTTEESVIDINPVIIETSTKFIQTPMGSDTEEQIIFHVNYDDKSQADICEQMNIPEKNKDLQKVFLKSASFPKSSKKIDIEKPSKNISDDVKINSNFNDDIKSDKTVQPCIAFEGDMKKKTAIKHNREQNVALTDPLDSEMIASENYKSLSHITDKTGLKIVSPQVKFLNEEIRSLLKQCLEKEDDILKMSKDLKESKVQNTELHKQCLQLEHNNKKLLKSTDHYLNKYEDMKKELEGTRTQIADLKKRKTELNNLKSELERNLAQSRDQNQQLKSDLEATKKNAQNVYKINQLSKLELEEEKKIVTQQKTELYNVVVKQMKLIHNLKRQILHLKAGTANGIVEQQLMKAIEGSF